MLPTHFRWVWYLVGLAGMVLTVVGILAILGSAADLGILVPVVFVGAVAVGYALIRFRRSLDAAVANAPSRQGQPAESSADPSREPRAGTGAATDAADDADGTEGAARVTQNDPDAPAGGPSAPEPAAAKKPSGPPRTSRR